jgi:atypical dual specificity phosphatase
VFRRFLSRPANFSWIIEGKIAGSARPENESQLLWLKRKGIKVLVSLNKEHPLDQEEVKAFGFEYVFIPVHDFMAPTLEDIKRFVEFSNEKLSQNKPVAVSCEAGIGRTGTMLAAYLVSQCWSPEKALREVKEKRGSGVESLAQRQAVFEYARLLGKFE